MAGSRPTPHITLTAPVTSLGIAQGIQSIPGAIMELPINLIDPNPLNPVHRAGNTDDLADLAETIRTVGLIHPIVVLRAGNRYQLLAGHRRMAAAQLIGRTTIPAVIRDDLAGRELEVMLAENSSRLDLTPMEEAAAYRQLVNQNLTQTDIAHAAGVTQGHVSRRLALLTLPVEVQTLIHEGLLFHTDAYQQRHVDPAILTAAARQVRANPDSHLGFADWVVREQHQATIRHEQAIRDLDFAPRPDQAGREPPPRSPLAPTQRPTAVARIIGEPAEPEPHRADPFLLELTATTATTAQFDALVSAYLTHSAFAHREYAGWVPDDYRQYAWTTALDTAHALLTDPTADMFMDDPARRAAAPLKAHLIEVYQDLLTSLGYTKSGPVPAPLTRTAADYSME